MSDAKLKEGIERILQTPAGQRIAVMPLGMPAGQVFELASAVERYHAHARAIGVSEDRAHDLLEGEMVKARVRADFTTLEAVTSADHKLIQLPAEDPWFWLSFADGDRPRGDQLLGVVVIQAPSFEAAIWRSHRDKLNPGGECIGDALPADLVPDDQYRGRLLDKTAAGELAASLDARRGITRQ